ncbi:protein kinase [Actinoplanes sp. NPDC048796]|uniref:serine/threonine-protein kinase n=1 Tax=unclassified Actinoplanes TaxID=2626549 RepID=UPI0033CBF998
MEVRETLGGRYKLLGELGSGGMAVVWRARDEVLGRRVAVKVLAARFAGDPQSRARIRDEARAAATLSHPNIAQVYDFGEASETGTPLPYVVMELINGPTLQQRVASGPLPPRKVFRICGEVAAALAAAHADGLVHRDIKMANIMVTPAGAKVVDFGIAAAVGLEPEEMLVGTPAYLAPERLAGAAVEPASDVYALGVLLYRLLAHESPWSVESTTQMLQAHVYVEPAPLPDLPGVPPAVADLIARCLRKDPAERPTASEVSVTLADAAEAAAMPSPTVLVEEVPQPPVRRRKWLVAGGAAAVALTVGGLALWGLTGDEQAERRPQAVAAPTSPGPAASRGLGAPTVRATRGAPAPVVTASSGPPATVASGPPPSVDAPLLPLVPTGSVTPTPSDSAEAPPPASAAPPEGRRIGSAGGSVYAVCERGKARLTGWEPAAGYTAKEIEAGPAFTARILFATADTEVEAGQPAKKYRITVTCVAGRPTPVVLPL